MIFARGRRLPWALVLCGLGASFLPVLRRTAEAQPPAFDKLADADRKIVAERFRRDVWPLLSRGGKDGCVGCHSGRTVSGLRFAGAADKDFAMLLREGFFLKDDPGSLLARVQDRDKKRLMPPPPRPSWTDAEKKILADLVAEIHKREKS